MLDEGLCRIQHGLRFRRSLAWGRLPEARSTGEVEMRAKLQSANDRLRQLEKDNVERAAHFAELKELRETVRRMIVRRKQANLHLKQARLVTPTRSVNPASGFRTTG